jgi:hypothetical protein
MLDVARQVHKEVTADVFKHKLELAGVDNITMDKGVALTSARIP